MIFIVFFEGIYSNKLYEFLPGLKNKNFKTGSIGLTLRKTSRSMSQPNSTIKILSHKLQPDGKRGSMLVSMRGSIQNSIRESHL